MSDGNTAQSVTRRDVPANLRARRLTTQSSLSMPRPLLGMPPYAFPR